MCSNCNQESEVFVHLKYPEKKEYCVECAKTIIVNECRYFTAIGGGSSIIIKVKMGLETKEKAIHMYDGWPEIVSRLNAL